MDAAMLLSNVCLYAVVPAIVLSSLCGLGILATAAYRASHALQQPQKVVLPEWYLLVAVIISLSAVAALIALARFVSSYSAQGQAVKDKLTFRVTKCFLSLLLMCFLLEFYQSYMIIDNFWSGKVDMLLKDNLIVNDYRSIVILLVVLGNIPAMCIYGPSNSISVCSELAETVVTIICIIATSYLNIPSMQMLVVFIRCVVVYGESLLKVNKTAFVAANTKLGFRRTLFVFRWICTLDVVVFFYLLKSLDGNILQMMNVIVVLGTIVRVIFKADKMFTWP